MRTRLLREIEIAELGRVWTIGDAVVGRHIRQCQDLVQRQNVGRLRIRVNTLAIHC